jgi:hypothetical protein
MPFAAQTSITPLSMRRCSSEYSGWLDTNFSTPGIASAARIWLGVHSLKPIQRALPWRTTSVSASIVSSSGVSSSKRWHW